MARLQTFVAYRHTGESETVLKETLDKICEALGSREVDAYCTFFEESAFQSREMNARQIMDYAFSVIDKKDFLLVLQTSESKSEGMLMEVGYCIATSKPVVVATQSSVQNTYLPEMARLRLTFDTIDDLVVQLEAINFRDLIQ